MSGLKDFQQATVNRIEHLFFEKQQKRVLVSDEVGLGKTLIARGTIAKFAVNQKQRGDNLVKVVYICSNAAIAEQNLNKLRITSEIRAEGMNSSRLSMQHLNIFNQEHDTDLLSRYIQLIPLTPETSFRITARTGTVSERALIFAFLKRVDELKEYLQELEVAMIDLANSNWSWHKSEFEKQVVDCDKNSGGKYLSYMMNATEKGLNEVQPDGETLLLKVKKMCISIRENGMKRTSNNSAISRLRVMFSKISLERLEPDLVIMDEFQRFKYLINSDPESETGMLANKFFSSNNVKMLLLSATPYKMYSTLEEIDDTQISDHYSEFLDVMRFLNENEIEQEKFESVWNDYSIKLKEFSSGDNTLLFAKREAENAMYEKVCRTERISAIENADIIDDSSVKAPIDIVEQDVKAYVQAQKLLYEIGATYHVPVDYIKSTPYLLSFMRDYKLKSNIEKYFKAHPSELGKVNKSALWINERKLDKYEQIPSANARLEVLKKHAFTKNAELLLWMPPSKPYYETYNARSPYKEAKNFSKILVFSSWEMVPRMIAGLLSFEAERKTVGELAKKSSEDIRYFYTDNAGENAKRKRFPAPRLNFAIKDEQASAMSLFCLIYPSEFLSNCYNPIECLNQGLSLKEIEAKVKAKIKDKLITIKTTDEGSEDKRWYYMAPILLDSDKYYDEWTENISTLYENDEQEGKEKKNIGLAKHIVELFQLKRNLLTNEDKLGKMPNDLVEVLTDMAIASPAICINRTYNKYLYEVDGYNTVFASQIAKVFINRMNTPESTAVVELCYGKSEEAHWRNLLSYCKDGNMQAMFDEYAHLITNGLDKSSNTVQNLHNVIKESMSIRTTLYDVDTLDSFRRRVKEGKQGRVRKQLRTHFAVAFTKGEGNTDKSTDRKKIVRNAFNSPFRPFVLASTSIGQEGLDFHNYCRKIVHWNLPSNPIDLEQREGRINRFECLAIRQNIAQRYGANQFEKDVWNEMFEIAVKDTTENNQHSSDLIPFWGVPKTEDMVKIERIVPMYPFSRDISAYERMIKILLLYRLTLGQARQEELLEHIIKNTEEDEDLKKLFINLSPHYKKS